MDYYIYKLVHIFEVIFVVYIGFTAFYLLFFSIAGYIKRTKNLKNANVKRKIAVLIPGYKEDNVIVEVAKDALRQNYSSKLYDVVVIADSFKKETLEKLKKLDIILVEVSFDVSTKAKALNKAMSKLEDDYDIALVLDADNTMEPNFLNKINESFNHGYKVVQAHRVAKNTNTSMAVLDAISEEINNFIFRKAHRNVGLSAALIGSGMAFEYSLFKEMMKDIDAIGGFDKQLEMELLKSEITIEYLPDAYVYDEKVQKENTFANQRKRWLSAQFIYFSKNIFKSIYHLLFKSNVDYFDKVLQMGQLPRLIVLGLSIITASLYFLIHVFFYNLEINLFVSYKVWLIVALSIVVALALSVPGKFYNKKTLKAIFTLPKTFIIMLLTLFKLKGANKRYIHTEHSIN